MRCFKNPIIFVLFIWAALAGCKTLKPLYVNLGGSNPTKNSAIKIEAKDYLKSYAMCKCIQYGYEKDSVNLNDRSTGFLVEMAEDLLTPKVDSLISAEAKMYVYRKKTGSTAADGADKRLVMADCLFFSASERVSKMVDSLLKGVRSFPNYWEGKQ